MTNIDIANGVIFQALGVAKDSFDARLLSQKKIFLLQELGVDLGYSYNWYVRGPYSPNLTNYIFNNLDILREQDFSQYHLAPQAQDCVNTVNTLASTKPSTLSVPSWYELLASVLYIHKKWQKGNDYDTLIQYKPQYTEEQYNLAVQELTRCGCYS